MTRAVRTLAIAVLLVAVLGLGYMAFRWSIPAESRQVDVLTETRSPATRTRIVKQKAESESLDRPATRESPNTRPSRPTRPNLDTKPSGARSKLLLERAAAAQALGSSGGATAVPRLERMIAEEEDFVKQYALTALVRLKGKEALPAVVNAARSEHKALRLRAAHELGRIGDPRGLEVLEDLCRSKNPILRRTSVRSIGKMRTLPGTVTVIALDI
jgi:HEAT repeats/PBS lyase HEAT-like repeat